ncbi:PQQ-dependent sugar dehydrogenase [Stackebrandtia nassauensis]|uniref:Glucose sorbosone dehydrogenase n=1 Tax=Stackebrandtia nassauensis (strain DSM 44728 / CIP 108903 / NRRL B-16338 / NBRC 102104 / LLR-40K-21) TaxID=446470 RepID=D3PUL9_STANL|nr:PQQ-dependent sugar dehydrogenase [Stackebrandtia nassauensis]ADD43032.1 glucose sorbosone dehydrogenase [Stackebrandtia nassauensis DSM 44728]
MTTKRRTGTLLGAILAIAALTACAPAPSSNKGAKPSDTGDPDVVADNLEAPWSIAFHGSTPLVSERDSAKILELDKDGDPREVATIDGVAGEGEGGLLGLAVKDDDLFVYSTGAGENRVERYPIKGEAGALELGEPKELLDGIAAASYHNGGRIAFGPDKMLYVTTGDAGEPETAQDRKSLSGKILRMTPDGEVPSDNPDSDSLVYSFGHRNPQGMAWSEDGTMYATEFGQDTWDELNVIEPGGNYGWPEVEGIAEDEDFTDPVQQWEPAEASPSGMAITGDTALIANLRGERLFEVPLDKPSTSAEHFVAEFGRLRDVVVAPDGSLWMLTNNTDGRGDPGADDDRILSFEID